MTLSRKTSFVTVLVLSASLHGVARACSPVPPPDAHTIDTALADTDRVAPSVPVLREVTLSQDHGSPRGDSCGDLSSLSISLAAPATDDVTPADRMGYRFEVTDGVLPAGLTLPTGPVRAERATTFVYVYGESNADVRFTLRVYAVDEAGNESAAPASMTVVGHHEAGCSATGRSPSAISILGALGVLGVVGRRRRGAPAAR